MLTFSSHLAKNAAEAGPSASYSSCHLTDVFLPVRTVENDSVAEKPEPNREEVL